MTLLKKRQPVARSEILAAGRFFLPPHPIHVMIANNIFSENTTLEQQILDAQNQYVSQNPGYRLNEKAQEQIRASAKSYDRLVNDQYYLMKTEITTENACVVQFTTEQGRLISTYTFFNVVIFEAAK